MAKLPDKFSIAKAVEFIDSGGHKVRPVDVNGFALDDGTQQYSVAHPVVEVDSTGTVTTDTTQIKSTHKKVTSDPTGTPVIIVGGDGTSLGTVPGGGGGSPVNTIAPTISGARGGTLTATNGTWTGSTSLAGQWYADGVATGNTTTSYTDSDTTKSLEYRVTAQPGSVVASAYDGTLVPFVGYSEDFNSYADGTNLAAQYQTGASTYAATPTPNIAGWSILGYSNSGASKSDLQIWGGNVKQVTQGSVSQGAIARDFGSASGLFKYTVRLTLASGVSETRRWSLSIGSNANQFSTVTAVDLLLTANGFGTNKLQYTAGSLTAQVTLSSLHDEDVFGAKLDATAKTLTLYQNDVVIGGPYDLSTWAGPWTTNHGFRTAGTTNVPPAGSILFDKLTYQALDALTATAGVVAQASGSPGKYQVNISAGVPAAGATGAEYKVETAAGEFVQGWTALAFASGTATGTYIIPDFAYEGQQLNVIVRNIGGTVEYVSALTGTVPYALQQQNRVAMNDTDMAYWQSQIPSRDIFMPLAMPNGQNIYVGPITGNSYHSGGVLLAGETVDGYHHWNEDYVAGQYYPHAPTTSTNIPTSITFSGTTATLTTSSAHGLSTGDYVTVANASPSAYNVTDVPITVTGANTFTYTMLSTPATNATAVGNWSPIQYEKCFYNGVQWTRTSNTPRTGTPPNPSDPDGTTSGWKRDGYAKDTVVGLKTDGWPSQLPSDTTLSIGFPVPSYFPTARYPVTVHCKTAPGVHFTAKGSNLSISNVDTVAGTFDLTIAGDSNARSITIDRSLTTSIDSSFFLSGVPSYETGAPAADVGAPYVGADKISDFAPFYGARLLKGAPIERFAGGRHYDFTSANVQADGSTKTWKYAVDMAHQLGLKVLQIAVPDLAADSFVTAMATYFKNNLDPTVELRVALGNEMWNFGYQNTQDLLAAATTAGIGLIQMYARKVNHMASLWRAVWGSSTKLKILFEWQLSSTATFQSGLDFESCYSNVDLTAMAPYYSNNLLFYASTPANIQAAVSANDYATFESLVDAVMRSAIDSIISTYVKPLFDWLPGYSVSKGMSKDKIGYTSYEAGPSIFIDTASPNPWDTNLGAGMFTRVKSFLATYTRSAAAGATRGYYIDQIAAKAPHVVQQFVYTEQTGGTQGFGIMNRTGNQTDEPYATMKSKALVYNV